MICGRLLLENDFAIHIVEREDEILEQLVARIALHGDRREAALAKMSREFGYYKRAQADIREGAIGERAQAARAKRFG